MSDSYADQVQQEKEQTQQVPSGKAVTILITKQPNSIDVEVQGPLGNDLLCYGMLEKARSHIQNIHLINAMNQMASKGNGRGLAGLLKKMGRG